ncbi:MAG: hypothetical protein GC149_07095 [Gammaproteobacteria bacterium]|nr:hypothetical protein [Gammaproteobacteria bacterium]
MNNTNSLNVNKLNTITYGVVILLFLSPLMYVGILRDPSDLPRYILLASVVCFASCLYLYYLIKDNEILLFTPVLILALAYVVLAGLSGAWAVEPSTNLVYFVRLVSFVALFFIAIQLANYRNIMLFAYASVFGAGLSALIGILQNHGFNIFQLRGSAMGGTFLYKNHAALYLDLIIPIGFTIVILSKNNVLKYLSALALSLCCIYILTSHTRGSYVALIVSAVLFFTIFFTFSDIRKNLIQSISKNKLPLLFLLTVVVSLSFLPGKADKFLQRPAYKGDKIDTSTRDRLTAYNNALYLMKKSPLLGSGYGTFWKAFRPYTNHPKIIQRSDEYLIFYRMHNDILQIVVELGVVGGLLFVSMISITYIFAYKMLRSDSTGIEKILVLGLILGLSASFVHSLVDFPLLKSSSAIQIWLYLGLINGLYAKKKGSFISIESGVAKVMGSVFGIMLTIAAILFYSTYAMSSYYAHLAETSYKNKDCNNTLNYINKAESLFYHDFFTHKLRVFFNISCNANMASLYDVLSQELSWDNTDIQALIKRGYILLDSNWIDKAGRDFRTVIYLLPHKASGYVGESYVLIASGKLEEAGKLLKKLELDYPENVYVKKAVQKLEQARQARVDDKH